MRVYGAGFGFRGLEFRVWGLGFGNWSVWGSGFGVWGLGSGVWGLGFGVWGLGFGVGVWGLGFPGSTPSIQVSPGSKSFSTTPACPLGTENCPPPSPPPNVASDPTSSDSPRAPGTIRFPQIQIRIDPGLIRIRIRSPALGGCVRVGVGGRGLRGFWRAFPRPPSGGVRVAWDPPSSWSRI